MHDARETAPPPSRALRIDNLQAYLAGDRRRLLARGETMPDRVRGCAIFGDISGFTAFTESLVTDFGPQRGAEELGDALDAVFGPLLDELERWGGDVIYFSGDAVTAWIDGDDGLLGAACALALRDVIERVGVRVTPNGREFRLRLKVALAAGVARRFVVGDPDVQLIDVLAGRLTDRLAAADEQARPGEVVVDAESVGALAGRVQFGADTGDVRRIQRLTIDVPPPPQRPPLPPLRDDIVRQWLLPSVYQRMSAGQGEFLAELRPATPLFMKFGGIDYDEDPDAIAALDAVVTTAQRVVAANGGNVLQLTIGDKGAYLYAIFGAPVAHGDDAARACATALRLREDLAQTRATGLQIGISTGRIRSGSYGSVERRTYVCLGDPVNLSARLMAAASAGTVLVSAEVRRAAGSAFDFGDMRRLSVKGRTGDVAVAELVDVRDGTELRTVGTTRLPLVGRGSELALLRELAASAIAGTGRVVIVSGESGVGKTRLVSELEQWLVEQGVRLRSSTAWSFTTQTAYGIWRGLLREAWAIDARAPAEAVIARLHEVLSAVDPRLLDRLPLLGPALGVPIPDTALTASFDAKLRKTSLESLIVTLLAANAARGPIAFLIDAAEHLDPLSLDLVDAVARVVPRMRVLLVITARAGSDVETLPLASLRDSHVMRLDPLDAESGRTLVRNQVGDRVSDGVLDELVHVGEGNPFHLEELVNYLVDRGIDPGTAAPSDITLPTSVHSLQLARIDVLDELPRRTLKVASVVGMRYDVPAVAGASPELGDDDVVARQLLHLVDAALVVPEGESAGAFLFRSETTRQVAYDTLPFGLRETLHDRIVSWLEEHTASDDAELDVLAYHAALGTDMAKKQEYLVRAGVAAQVRYANDAAVRYFEAALDVLDADERPAVQRRLGKVLEILGRWPQAQQAYETAVGLCQEAGDVVGAAQARTDLAEVHRKQGNFDEAGELLEHAGADFAALDDMDGRATVLHLQGTLASQHGDYDRARQAYEASLQIRRELDDEPKIGALLSNLAVVAEQLADYDTARRLNEQALAVRQAVGDPWAIAVSQNNLGMIALLQEDYARATGHIEASIALADKVGDRWIAAVGEHNEGIAQRGLGQFARSGRAFLRALQAYEDYDDRWSLMLLAEDVVRLAADGGLFAVAAELIAGADSLRAELEAPRPAPLQQQMETALAGAPWGAGVAGGAGCTGARPLAAVIREVCAAV